MLTGDIHGLTKKTLIRDRHGLIFKKNFDKRWTGFDKKHMTRGIDKNYCLTEDIHGLIQKILFDKRHVGLTKKK